MKENKNISLTRRKFVQTFMTAAAAALAPLGSAKASELDMETFLQKNFREMSPDEVSKMIKRIEAKYKAKYGKDFTVKTTPAMEGVEFGYGLNLSKCIGCRRCVYACVKENNTSRKPHQIQYIRVLKLKRGSMNVEESEHYYNPEKVPEEGYYYMPVQCQQCENPHCVKACPIKATWKEKDGIVVVDYNWCIACRYCMAACPYMGRRFNWAEPQVPADEWNTNTHYLGNRPRMKNVVEKCTFCIQRAREGKYTACVEICPVGARKFGNMLDPKSEVRQLLATKRVFRLKEELNTHPRFFYFFHS